jgi:hypothetical protein
MNTATQTDANTDIGEMFERDGYVVIRQFIPRVMCDYIARNIEVLEANGRLNFRDTQVPKAFSIGSPQLTETLLEIMTPILSQAINCELYPTYSYMRIYFEGAVLDKHQDRYSCEVSATLPLAYKASSGWPIWVEIAGTSRRIDLEPGDALIYKGIEVPHWRDVFDGERQVQVFLHYVKKDGAYSEFKYDKRDGLAHFW